MQIMLLKFRYRLCDCHDQCIDIPVLWQLNRLNVSLHIWMKCRENTTASGIPEHGLFCYFFLFFLLKAIPHRVTSWLCISSNLSTQLTYIFKKKINAHNTRRNAKQISSILPMRIRTNKAGTC